MPDDSNPFRLAGLNPLNAALTSFNSRFENKLKSASAAEKAPAAGGLKNAAAADKEKTEMEGAATQFEALLLHQMMKSMWNTVPKGGLLSGSQEEEIYRDMLNEGIAKDIAEKQSIGIKDVIVRDMQKFGKK